MKKRFFAAAMVAVLCITSLAVLTGCDKGEKAYDYDLSEYIKVGKYKGLEYKEEKVTVSDKEVSAEIDNNLQMATTTEEVKSGKVEDGDTINVSYKGTIDGKEFEGGSTDSSDITIGETAMIPGFIEGLIGQKVGDTVTLNLKFPEDYHAEDVAGKDVVFEVTIKCKKVQNAPEYNEAFVQANSDCKTIAEYEAFIKDGLLEAKKEQADETMKQGLWEQIVTASKVIKYPEKELEETTANTKKSMKDTVAQQGMNWEEYLAQTNMTEKEFDETMKEFAKKRVQQDLIVYAIADEENLKVSDKEYEEMMDDMLENAGFTEKTFKENFGVTIEEYCEEKGLRTSMLLNKVMDKVVEYGKLVK